MPFRPLPADRILAAGGLPAGLQGIWNCHDGPPVTLNHATTLDLEHHRHRVRQQNIGGDVR